jgi:hypothetical protein
MILGVGIVWFISFWCCGMSFAIYSSSLMKECKEFNGGRYEKINIGFQNDEGMLVFGFDFFLFAW